MLLLVVAVTRTPAGTVGACVSVPLTAMSIARLAVVPLAYRMARVVLPAVAALTVHSK